MARSPTGSALDLKDFTFGTGEYKDIMDRIRGTEKTFKEAKFKLAAEGNENEGWINIISNADASSKIMSDFMAELNGMLGVKKKAAGGPRFQPRNANIIDQTTRDFQVGRFATALKKVGQTRALAIDYNPSSHELEYMYEQGSGLASVVDGYRGKNKQIVDQRKAALHLKSLEDTPGSPEFRAKVFREQRGRAEKYDARLAWAKQNRRHPIGKAILKAHRNKTTTGRALNRAGAMLRGAAIGAVLSAIGTAVGSMVKFLSLLPSMANNLQKVAVQGAMYNISDTKLREYAGFSQRIGLDDTGDVFKSAQGQIHGKLSSVINGDINGVLGNMAALSAIAGGRTTNASVRYFAGDIDNPDDVMKAVINDVMSASFRGLAVGKSGLSANNAFARNMRDADAAFGMGGMLSKFYEVWQDMDRQGLGAEKARIRDLVVSGNGDFLTEMMKIFKPQTVDAFVGGPSVDRGEEVTKTFNDLYNLWNTIKDSVLLKILDQLEPMAQWLRSILIGVLEILNNTHLFGMKGAFNEALAELYNENIEANARKKNFAETQLQAVNLQVEKIKTDYGYSDRDISSMLKNYEAAGILPAGMSAAMAQDFFTPLFVQSYLNNKLKEFDKPNIASGKTVVAGLSETAVGYETMAFLQGANQEYFNRLDNLFSKEGLGFMDRITSEREKALLALSQMNQPGFLTSNATVNGRPSGEAMSHYVDDLFSNKLGFGFNSAQWMASTMDEWGQIDTVKGYKDIILMYLDMLSDLEKITPELAPDGIYSSRNLRGAYGATAREAGENTIIASQVISEASRRMGEDFVKGLGEGTIRFEGVISAEKREYTITLKDPWGRVIDTLTDISTPSIRNDKDIGAAIPWRNYMGAVQPVPK